MFNMLADVAVIVRYKWSPLSVYCTHTGEDSYLKEVPIASLHMLKGNYVFEC